MHECLEQFKHWLEFKRDDVFWAVCVCTTGNAASMGIGFRLAPLRSRWAGLVWFRQNYRGHMQDSSRLLTGFVLSVSRHTCACSGPEEREPAASHLHSRQSFPPVRNVSSLTNRGGPLVLFHQCDHCVTMETGLLSCNYTPLKLLIRCWVIQSAIMTRAFWKSFSSLSNICLPVPSEKRSCSTYCHFESSQISSASRLLALSIAKHTAVTRA